METFPLQKGSKGPRVQLLQKGLNLYAELRAIPDRIQEDGDFGAKTEALLLRLLYRKQVTEKLWKTLEKASPAAAGRLAEMRRTGKPSADQRISEVMDHEFRIFTFLLETYATYEKTSEQNRKAFKNAFGAAFDLAARQRLRVAKYDGATKDMMFVRLGEGDPRYGPLIKKYVSGQPVFGNGVGFAPVAIFAVPIAVMIVGAVVTSSVVNWLTPAYSESTVDFKKTKEIQQILDKLPKEDQVKLEAEIEQQIDKAYATGRRDEKWGSLVKIAKPAAILGGLWLGYTFLVKPRLAAINPGRA